MSIGQWVWGCLVLGSFTLPLLLVAPRPRRRLDPHLLGWPARLADALLWVALVVVTAEALGTVGLLRRLPLLFAGPLAAALLYPFGRARDPREAQVRGLLGRGGTPFERKLAVIAVVGAFAQAATSVAVRAQQGIYDPDSLHYHLTFAARFARSGSTTGLALVSASDASPYHPATTELLHALGLVAFGSDVLSLVLNLVALVLALLAAAAFGARWNRTAGAVTAVAAVVTLPLVGRESSGPGNDLWAVAFVLATAAFAAWSVDGRRRTRGTLVLTGMSAGLAVGTKLTAAIPVALVVLALVASSPTVRSAVGRFAVMLPAGFVVGGYWTMRNLLHVGNPFPALDIGIGSLRLPRPPMPGLDGVSQSVAHYLGDREVVRTYFVPGVQRAFGPALVLLVALLGVGIVLALRDRPSGRFQRLLTAAGLLAVVGYLLTPTTAAGAEGAPTLFRFNLRYAVPALVLLTLVSVTNATARRLGGAVTLAWFSVEVVTLTSSEGWPTTGFSRPVLVLACVVGMCVLAAYTLRALRSRQRTTQAALGGACIVALIAVAPLAQAYEDNRYATPTRPRDQLVAIGRDLQSGRTGVSGQPLQYSFFGPDLRADASYVSEVLSSNEVRDPQTCVAWRAALRKGRYQRIVIVRFPNTPPAATEQWTASIPGVRVIEANEAGVAYDLPPAFDDTGCAPAALPTPTVAPTVAPTPVPSAPPTVAPTAAPTPVPSASTPGIDVGAGG